jgi:phenylalanine-4-hydroxylase
LLPISSIGETITPNGMNISDDEVSELTYEIYFEKPATIYLKVRKIIRQAFNLEDCQFLMCILEMMHELFLYSS